MEILLCTIGFAGKTAEEFFRLLAEAQVEKLIDVRLNRGGQLSGFAKDPDLAYLLEKVAGISYAHEPKLAPTAELLNTYREDKDWPAYETGFLELMQNRGVPQTFEASAWPSRGTLLCSEPGPEKCHRRLVADLLAAHWIALGHQVEIQHLVAAHSKRSSKSPKPRANKPKLVP
ncbi:MAG TPA: DUF488 domain-containing protein [Candidatus Acidoferrum sp.]|jgi:uncharacterized protein (DUF488 family)